MTNNIDIRGAKHVVVIERDEYRLIWVRVESNKWTENFFKKFEGEEKFTFIHTAKYSTDDDVEDFVTQLLNLGYYVSLIQ